VLPRQLKRLQAVVARARLLAVQPYVMLPQVTPQQLKRLQAVVARARLLAVQP